MKDHTMKKDPIAMTLRAIVLLTAILGFMTTLATAPTLPAFGVVCYCFVFIFAAAIAIFNP